MWALDCSAFAVHIFYIVNAVCTPDTPLQGPFLRNGSMGVTSIVTTRDIVRMRDSLRILDWCTGKYQVKCWTLGQRLSFGERQEFVRETETKL